MASEEEFMEAYQNEFEPEGEFEIELLVKVKSYGKDRQRGELAYRITKLLVDRFETTGGPVKVHVFHNGEEVHYDPIVDGGHGPEGYTPRWLRRDHV